MQRSGVSADDFVLMLALLGDAHSRESSSRGGRPQHGGSTSPGILQIAQALIEESFQEAREMITGTSIVLCLSGLRCIQRINHILARCCCGFRRGGRDSGKVSLLTGVHWSLVNIIVQLQGLKAERLNRRNGVHYFLRRYSISAPLAARVKRYIRNSQPQQIRDHNINALRKTSVEILADIQTELRGVPPLAVHPFFGALQKRHPHLVQELCREALRPMLTARDEIVFYVGTACECMYFIVYGQQQYATLDQNADQRKSPDMAGTVLRRVLHGGQWLGEAALWTGWIHRGELRSLMDSFFFTLNATCFAQVISAHKAAHMMAASYARKFVESLNRGPQSDLADPPAVDQ